MTNENALILAQNVSISQREEVVLSQVNFAIRKGEFVYLIGKTGSGKSSLLKSLFAEIPVKSGSLEVLSQNLIKIKKRKILALRRNLGIIFQDFQLLTDRSIFANLDFVLKSTGWKDKNKRADRIKEVIDMVGLKIPLEKYPHQISGGEQQRVAVARALLNNPELLIADEPTGNLDPETTDEIMRLLFEISKSGKTVIMATHEYEMIQRYPSRTLKCEGGSLIEVSLAKD